VQCCLEDGRPEHRSHQLLSLRQRPGEIAAVVLDVDATIVFSFEATIKLDRDIAYFVAEGKSGLGRLGEMNQVFAVDFEVNPLQALQRGHDAGFGESGHLVLSFGQNYIRPLTLICVDSLLFGDVE